VKSLLIPLPNNKKTTGESFLPPVSDFCANQ
jgi:hypothetical protein